MWPLALRCNKGADARHVRGKSGTLVNELIYGECDLGPLTPAR